MRRLTHARSIGEDRPRRTPVVAWRSPAPTEWHPLSRTRAAARSTGTTVARTVTHAPAAARSVPRRLRTARTRLLWVAGSQMARPTRWSDQIVHWRSVQMTASAMWRDGHAPTSEGLRRQRAGAAVVCPVRTNSYFLERDRRARRFCPRPACAYGCPALRVARGARVCSVPYRLRVLLSAPRR